VKRNDFYEKLLSKPVGAEWTADEKAALPAAAEYLDALRAENAVTMADLKKMAGQVTVTLADRHFADPQLPLNYAPHIASGGKVSDGRDGYPKGTCLVDSWKIIEGTVARGKHIGDDLSYEAPFRRIR
jgi:hypothetical protein